VDNAYNKRKKILFNPHSINTCNADHRGLQKTKTCVNCYEVGGEITVDRKKLWTGKRKNTAKIEKFPKIIF
jgi:hypothetical protein